MNGIDPNRPTANGWLMDRDDIQGFRVPVLGVSSGLWPTLKDMRFTYDCSKTASSTYWPEKNSLGVWNFPLASLKIAGTGKRTLSMDYNFYVAHSGAKPDAGNKALYAQQTYETYLAWFQQNYAGSRAPLNIGHHFSLWNGGAYHEALTRFVEKVCGLPEVRCVTYQEYVRWLEELVPETLASYRRGDFEKARPLELGKVSPTLDVDLKLRLNQNTFGKTRLSARSKGSEQLKQSQIWISVAGQKWPYSDLSLEDIRSLAGRDHVEVTAHLVDENGVEVARTTQILRGLNTNRPELGSEILEERALMGDLPEAHQEEP